MERSFLHHIVCFRNGRSVCVIMANKNNEGLTRLRDRAVNLADWWFKLENRLVSPSKENDPKVLDLRPSKEFEKCCLVSDKFQVIPLSINVMKERSFELPARHVEFDMLLPPSDLEVAQNFLLGTNNNKGGERPKKPWKIRHVLLDTPELWETAKSLGISGQHAANFPSPRLWEPDAMVQNVLLPLLLKQESPLRGEIWDLASGAGRDVVFLAEELKAAQKPYTVVALDHRYNAKQTNIVTSFFQRRGIEAETKCIRMDLSKWDDVKERITPRLSALYMVRFWKPAFVEALANSNLPENTLFGISHFCKPHEGASWEFDHPSERTVLERNQLSQLFCSWNILYDEIDLDSDHGRTMIHFVAQKRKESMEDSAINQRVAKKPRQEN